MLFSRNWLAEYVELPDDEELVRRLTMAGHNVELTERRDADLLLDVDVTTNRPDCMSHLGLAREVAVLFDRSLEMPRFQLPETGDPISGQIEVEVAEPELCTRYVARLVRGVSVRPSPPWLAERLEALGLRPINNVVDVTNFVLWEYGQPLHAFDLAKLDGPVIRVRRAAAGEPLVTLDGERRELDPERLVIADAARPVALAGVIGGEETAVSLETTDVLLESACFDPVSVRRTARRYGLQTDSSHRFERGTDPEVCLVAANRAAALIAEMGGGQVAEGAIDVVTRPFETRSIPLDPARLDAFAGVEIPAQELERWLWGLGCEVEKADTGPWRVRVPSWRDDLELPADLYEEAIRLYGYDRIPSSLPALAGSDGPSSPALTRRRRVRRHLAACGFAEAIDYAFHDREADEQMPTLFPDSTAVALENPLSERYTHLRRSLLPNLVASARANLRRDAPSARLFELGNVFLGGGEDGVVEREVVALVAGGEVGLPWDGARRMELFTLKGVVEDLAAALGVRLSTRGAFLPGLVEGTTAELLLGDPDGPRPVGLLGRVVGDDAYPLFAAELWLDQLPASAHDGVRMPSRFPGVEADHTLTHPVATPWAQIARAVEEAAVEDLVWFGLKDRYTGEGVPEGAVNTTISFFYNSEDRSLTQEEVNERQAALARRLEERFGWRGGG